MWRREKRTYAYLFTGLFLWLFICMYVFQLIYTEARKNAISDLNSRQMILAGQAKVGIEDFFQRMTSVLVHISQSAEVGEMTLRGRSEMDYALSLFPGEITAITRVDRRGRVIYTVPYVDNVIGKDISDQPHVRQILTRRKTVISDVFTSVQGYPAVALHVPVFDGEAFTGTLAVLINFYALSKRFLEGIRLGETGYAWMTSEDGIELYCPVPGHVGKSVFDNCRKFPSIIAMANEMVKGRSGTTTYRYDRIRNKETETAEKHAVFLPIQLADTFWTIVVASSGEELLSSLNSFKNKLVIVLFLVLAGCLVFAYYGMKSWGIIREAAERKKAEKSLQDSHERFFTVLNSIDATVYVADMETHEILFMNQYMVESFGKDYTGDICWKVFRGESGPCPHCSNEKLVGEDGNPTGVYTWQDRNPLTGKWYINHDRAIPWVDGRMVRLQIATDVTLLKKLERQIREAQKMESIGNLAGGIAHDFNNILFPIIGMAEMLLDDLPAGSLERENAREIFKAGKRGSDLVKQILAFSRQSKHQMAPILLQNILEEALKLLRSTIPSNVEIVPEIQADCGFVAADATQIHQVAINLITNAYHAVETGSGTIRVRLEEESVEANALPGIGFGAVLEPDFESSIEPGRYAVISVSDTGYGIPEDLFKKIFDPYFTTKEQGKGTGLGLAVVYGIIREHQGHIRVHSEVGRGTTFRVYLPLMKHSPEPYVTPKTEGLLTGSERILLVDDEPAIAALQQQMIERLGYRVTTRGSSLETLEVFKARPDEFDLVISDMTMPNLTGDQLAFEIKAIRPGIPIIICTGFSERLTEEKIHELGIAGLLMKPVVRSDMARLIRQVLDNR